jgi:DNA invertase Pin-like site-specific DNA recombinase
LARSTRDLLNALYTVTERGAAFKSLADQWVDTSSAMGEFMLTVLGGVATLERHLIKARTDTGIKRARACLRTASCRAKWRDCSTSVRQRSQG